MYRFEDRDYATVKQEHIRHGQWVSTVWLGLDHSYGHGPPIIFETLIFGGPHDGDMWRCSTEEQAMAQHLMAVQHARRVRGYVKRRLYWLRRFATAQYPQEVIDEYRTEWQRDDSYRQRNLRRAMRGLRQIEEERNPAPSVRRHP